ncbi:MAG: flagellar FlbD family protein [Bdellovibrionota bacterium]
MLLLTKLDNTKVLVNIESIKYIEANPDTRILFLNGDSMIIKESLDAIEENMIKLKASILAKANAQDSALESK